MEQSNIVFSSNVYPAKGIIKEDKEYISKITDYARLKSIDNKINSITDYSVLSSIQHHIIKNGTLCNEAKNDPCWGIIKYGDDIVWGCKCVNTECKIFSSCRSDYDPIEYEMFSPEKNNSSADFLYQGVAHAYYYPITYGSENENISFDDDYITIFSSPADDIKPNCDTSGNNIDAIKSVSSVEIKDDKSLNFESGTLDQQDEKDEFDELIVQSKREIDDLLKTDEEFIIPENIFEKFLPIEQKDIIQSETNANIFVDAGPGTGKTYTLIEKINYLVSNLNIDPEGIQVLSFTNAAVTEIKNRLNEFVKNGGDRGLRNVDVRTFHSLAWWLLGQANERLVDRGWKTINLSFDCINYEESILRAAKLIKQFPDIVSGWNHFIVDEIQDLTGSKAIFVMELIRACMKEGCGFSILGDSCQAIYDYTEEENNTPITSDEFYNMLYRDVHANSRLVRLEKNHRQTDNLIELTMDLRSAILDRSEKKLIAAVTDLNEKIPKLDKGAVKIDKEDVNSLSNGESLCFLCRNNGQTLRLSTMFRKRQIPHVVNAYELVENFAPWIGEVFFAYDNNTITFEQFASIIKDKNIDFLDYSVQDVWERIKNLLRSKSEIIDVEEFLEALRACKTDDTIFRFVPNSNIVVSNIHRAKGREYDRVILDESFIKGLETKKQDIGEYKTLYVAITRPKKAINICKLSNTHIRKFPIYKTGRKRWLSYTNHKLSYFEFKFEDYVDKSTFVFQDAVKLQHYISTIKPGDEIKLKRIINDGKLNYSIVHVSNDTEIIIGKTNNNLVEDLEQFVKPNSPVDMPAYIEDLFVDSVYTHIEESQSAASFSDKKTLTGYRVWNWVNIQGLGHLIYDTY